MRKIAYILAAALLLSGCNGTRKATPGEATLPLEGFASWSPTPPMGWNSWDCYGPTVVEGEVKANADYMAEHLKDYGWEYVVVDIRWFVANDKAGGYNQDDPIYSLDEFGRYIPAVNRFPSSEGGKGFKPLADYVHSKGLKFGIHIMRGIPKKAVEEKLPILGASGVTADQVYSEENLCKWLRDNYTVDSSKIGAQEYYNSIFQLYASWGVDFIKIDDLSAPIYHEDEIDMIRKAIDECGRPIVLSTSPGETPVSAAEHVSTHANMWRMVDDVWDQWKDITHIMDVAERWYPYIGKGTWPDCDMLPLGHISIRGERGKDRLTRLSSAEQKTMMTFWCIFRSPLMFGGDLPTIDDATLKLLTNKDVLRVHQKGDNVRRLIKDESRLAITSSEGGKRYLALFNTGDKDDVTIEVPLSDLGLGRKASAKDLWSGEVSKVKGSVKASIAPHDCVLLSLE